MESRGPAIPVLYGKNGLVWGRGVLGTDEPGTHKQEHDGRAPAGVFRIGTIYTYDTALPEGSKYPFHTVDARDAWVDDITSPDYNKHVVVPDPANPPPWFEKQKMRPWRLRLPLARRNPPQLRPTRPQRRQRHLLPHPPRPPARKTAGCTTMAEEDLVRLIRWLRADQHPHYALLPQIRIRSQMENLGPPHPQEAAAVLP